MGEPYLETETLTCCEECGASIVTGSSCEEIFNSFLSLEFSNSVYGAVHFLTVACMMVQHRRYSMQGMAWIQDHLQRYLRGELTETQIREENRRLVDSKQRAWKILRGMNEPVLPAIRWSMTIQDIALQFEDDVTYRKLISQWANTVYREMAVWFEKPELTDF